MKTAVATPTVSFASKLYPYMGKVTENSFFSPFSIQVALGMTQAGANGDTLAALANLLESPTDKEEAKAFYKKLVDEVNSKEERPYELTTANALWGQVGYKPPNKP